MKQLIILVPLLFAGCSSAPRPVANSNQPATNVANQSSEVKSVLAHSSEGQQPGPSSGSAGAPGKWSRSGDPVDTSAFDSKIAAAEKDHKAKPGDATAKKVLAEAYFERGFALTEVRQYAAALGDYRKALKLDPGDEESKKWIEQIENIYASIKKEAPREGEEPAPLPFKKESKP
jgi:tetratricopeptide (TPR) repeat protein